MILATDIRQMKKFYEIADDDDNVGEMFIDILLFYETNQKWCLFDFVLRSAFPCLLNPPIRIFQITVNIVVVFSRFAQVENKGISQVFCLIGFVVNCIKDAWLKVMGFLF